MADVVENANWGRANTCSSMSISLAAERRAHLKMGVAALVWETTTTLTTRWQKGHGTLTLMASLGSEETIFLLMMRYNVNKSSSSFLGPSLPHWHRKKNMIGLLPFCPQTKPDTLLWRCSGRWQRRGRTTRACRWRRAAGGGGVTTGSLLTHPDFLGLLFVGSFVSRRGSFPAADMSAGAEKPAPSGILRQPITSA